MDPAKVALLEASRVKRKIEPNEKSFEIISGGLRGSANPPDAIIRPVGTEDYFLVRRGIAQPDLQDIVMNELLQIVFTQTLSQMFDRVSRAYAIVAVKAGQRLAPYLPQATVLSQLGSHVDGPSTVTYGSPLRTKQAACHSRRCGSRCQSLWHLHAVVHAAPRLHLARVLAL